MRFFQAVIAGASAFAALVAAQSNTLLFTEVPTSVEVGRQYTIRYSSAAASSPVTITLRRGINANLQTVSTLTSSATGGTYTWTPDRSLASGGDYALQITQGSEINYSGQFAITGGNPAISASASASSALSSAAASLSSALSSQLSAITSNATASMTMSHYTNSSTMATSAASAGSTTRPASTGGASATGSASTSAPTTGAAANIKSPAALVLGAVVAMAYLN